MNINQLEYVLKVAQTGSISKAAKELYISQPSLSKAITNLENRYQIQIFERTSKGIHITAEGKDFLYYAKKVMMSVDAIDETFTKEIAERKTVLSVASQQFDFLYDLSVELYEQYKTQSIHFNLVETNRSQVIQSVLEGDVNLGIIVRSSGDSNHFKQLLLEDNLSIHLLDHSNVYVSVGKASTFYNHSSITPEELIHSHNAILDMEDEVSQNLYMVSGQHYFNQESGLFFNTINACIHFLLHTDVHLFTPKWVLGFFENLDIHSIPLTDQNAPTTELVWMKRKNDSLSPIEQQFIKHLQCVIQRI